MEEYKYILSKEVGSTATNIIMLTEIKEVSETNTQGLLMFI